MEVEADEVSSSEIEAFDWFDIIPFEIIWIILQFCKTDDWFAFGKTRKRLHLVVKDFLRSGILNSAYQNMLGKTNGRFKRLYGEQVRGLLTLNQNLKSSIFLRSPMGSGKTMMALLHAFDSWEQRGVRTMILATSKCIGSWEEHLKCMGMKVVKCRPEQSDYILFHGSSPKHRSFVTPDNILTSPYFILLTTRYYIKSCRYRKLRKLLEEQIFEQIVVDEAHLMTEMEWFIVNKAKRRILLSADAMPSKIEELSEANPALYYEKEFNLSSNFEHKVEMRIEFLPREKGGEVDALIDLLNSPDFKGRKVILFTQWNAGTMKRCIARLSASVPEYKFFKFNNANLAAKTKFTQVKKGVLVTTIHTATEGTNFEMADTVIYTKFGSGISLGKARQCFARVRRRNNPNPVVMNYAFYVREDSVNILRTRTNVAYALANTIDMVLENKTTASIKSIAKKMIEDGIDILSIPDPELLTIFTSNHDPKVKSLPFSEEDYSFPLMDIIRYMHFS